MSSSSSSPSPPPTIDPLVEEDWNVDDERGDHESDEHWELRRNFLTQNRGRFPKLRLLSLSQVFVNVEFLGCRYPEATEELVKSLSLGIVEDYRKSREGRLQRTFVKASDAAERKSKGNQRMVGVTAVPGHRGLYLNNPTMTIPNNPRKRQASSPPRGHQNSSMSPPSKKPSISTRSFNDLYKDPKLKRAVSEYKDDLIGLVLSVNKTNNHTGETPLQILHRSCSMSKKEIKLEVEADGTVWRCELRIGSHFIVKGIGTNKPMAKSDAASKGLSVLQRLCYTIECEVDEKASTDFSIGKPDMSPKTDMDDLSNISSSDSIGIKLMKQMGWTGGSLGKTNPGIIEPVTNSVTTELINRTRFGLGHEANQTGMSKEEETRFTEGVRTLLQSHMDKLCDVDLDFTSDFNTNERKIIHLIANQFGLKSKSKGKGSNRHIIVSRRINNQELLMQLLSSEGTIRNQRQRVIPPSVLTT